jgi:hypothetical protein
MVALILLLALDAGTPGQPVIAEISIARAFNWVVISGSEQGVSADDICEVLDRRGRAIDTCTIQEIHPGWTRVRPSSGWGDKVRFTKRTRSAADAGPSGPADLRRDPG